MTGTLFWLLIGLLFSASVWAGLMTGWALAERKRVELLVQLLNDRPIGDPRPAKMAQTPDAEERAYVEIRERGLDLLANKLYELGEGKFSEKKAREEAERLVTGAESFGNARWP